ncbi:MAG: ATP-binding protein [Colwellia sp.]|nr:ATP-binding protein [Colwellia sp.]
MKRLYISIIFVVLGAIFVTGWGLDKLVSNDSAIDKSGETKLYEKLIEGFHYEFTQVSQEHLSIKASQLSKQFQLTIVIKETNSIALPIELHQQLNQAGGLLLEAETGSYLLKELEKYPNKLIQLNIPNEPVRDTSYDMLLTIVLYLCICLILVLWLLPLTRRLYLLNTTASKIAAGDISARVPTSHFSYLHIFEKSFNNMANQIEKLFTDNKILARSLSHDIRTPMACLRFGIDAAIDSTSIEKKDNYIRRMDDELTRMEEMTEAFLEYASLEQHSFHLRLDNSNINDLLLSVGNDCLTLAEKYNIKLIYNLPQDAIHHTIDFHWCYRAFQNLIGNAVQHAKSTVKISANIDNHSLTITIEDDGAGIPEDKQQLIFEPFIKLDKERARADGHFGLGLAITAKVVSWHNATIVASTSKDLMGAKITVCFPIN